MSKTKQKSGFELDDFLPHKLSLLSRLTQELLSSTLDKSGLTIAHWRVYICLSSNGPMQLKGIVEFTRLPQSSLSRSIAHLANKGLVSITKSEQDRRISIVELTGEGRRQFKELTKVISRECDHAFAMSSEQSVEFIRLVDTLTSRLVANKARGG